MMAIKQRSAMDKDWNEVEIVAFHSQTNKAVIKRADGQCFPCGDPYRVRSIVGLIEENPGELDKATKFANS